MYIHLCYVMFYLAGLRVQGPASRLCALTPGGGGGGSIKTTLYDPCFRSIHNVQGFPADLQLLNILLDTYSGQAAHCCKPSQPHVGLRFYVHYRSYSTYVQCAFQAALKAASHHSDTLVCFCVHCHSISNIGELPDISIHIAMFATLHLPTSAYPLLQLD